MPQFYVYLISSLPMLHFGAKPPFTSEKFLNMCGDFIPDEDLYTVGTLCGGSYAVGTPCGDSILFSTESPQSVPSTLINWQQFDIALRNELVKIRAAKKHVDPLLYMRPDGHAELSVTHIALAAARSLSIIEAEKILDQERWHFLDELSVGHYFDLDFLIIYTLKLQILERWAKVNSADPVKEVRQLC